MVEIPHVDDYTDICPVCGSESECFEYDSDDDLYLMRCTEKGHDWTLTDPTEVWK